MIYKLNYKNKETAIKDLLKKGVYTKELSYGKGIQAVVEIGKIILTNGVYDEDFKEITAPIYADGYAYDVMSDVEIDFGKNEIFPNNPKHGFAGYELIVSVKPLA